MSTLTQSLQATPSLKYLKAAAGLALLLLLAWSFYVDQRDATHLVNMDSEVAADTAEADHLKADIARAME